MMSYGKRMVAWIVTCGTVYAFWRWYSNLLMPFVLAVLFSVWLDPVVAKLQRWGLSRSVGALLALIFSILGIFLVMILLTTVLVAELKQLMKGLPSMVKTTEEALHPLLAKVGDVRHQLGQIQDGTTTASRLVESIFRFVANFLVHLPDTVLMLMVAVMAAFFIMRDKELLVRQAMNWIPPALRPSLVSLQMDITSGALGFIKAQIMLVSMTCFGTMTGLVLFRFHYAVFIGVLAGLLDFIPYMGPTTILIPWALITFIMGYPVTTVKLLIVMFGVALMRQIAEPRLVGDNTGLHPLIAILALYLGVQFFGPSGFVVGPISAVIIKAIVQVLDPPSLDSGV